MTDQAQHQSQSLWRKLLWFVALWLGGVGTVAAVAYGIRAVLL